MISIIIPVIRKEKFERCVKAIIKNSDGIVYEIVAEKDEKRIGCPKMVKTLTRLSKYDWVMFLGDDTIPQEGFLKNAVKEIDNLPDKWGMIGLNDQHQNGEKVATHWLCHKKLLSLTDGEFFHTGYNHLWCDNELTDIAKEAGRYIWAEDAVIEHDHPMVNGSERDEDFYRIYDKDKARADHKLYLKRKEDRIGHALGIGFPVTDEMLHTYFFFSMMLMDLPSYNLYFPKQFYHASSLPQCRNDMARNALRDGCTHLLMMDTDQVYHDKDLVRRLLGHKLDIVGAKVHRRWPPFEPIANRWDGDKVSHVPDSEMEKGGLVQCDATGTGCILIRTSVFLDLEEPYFEFKYNERGEVIMGEDISFCKAAGEAGYKIFVDCDAKIGHLAQFHVDTAMYQLFKKLNKVT